MSLHPKRANQAAVAGSAIAERMAPVIDALRAHRIPADLTTVAALTYVAADMLKVIADSEPITFESEDTWATLGRSAWRYAEVKHE